MLIARQSLRRRWTGHRGQRLVSLAVFKHAQICRLMCSNCGADLKQVVMILQVEPTWPLLTVEPDTGTWWRKVWVRSQIPQ